MDIILYLLNYIQYQHKQICCLLNFICRYIPLKQWAFDDSHSPKYQKFKIDQLPVIKTFIKQNWQFLLEYYQWKYGKPLKPVQRRNGKSIPEDTVCPLCGAPHHFLYDNNGGNGQYQCKVCAQTFSSAEVVTTPFRLTCPHCGNSLVAKKDRKFFRIHKCVNPKCPYYLHNLNKVEQKDLEEDYGKNKYKLHYIYREFTVDFFAMDLNSLPKHASSLRLTNDDAVLKEFRPYKQMIERLNRTYKQSYRPTNGFDNYDGANYDLALWVVYYNFFRPHKHVKYQALNKVDMLDNADNMPDKWQLLIFLGQQTILNIQNSETAVCS